MGSGGPDWQELGAPALSGRGCVGFYLRFRDELKHDHAAAYAATLPSSVNSMFLSVTVLKQRKR
jgi:hypothetical protein